MSITLTYQPNKSVSFGDITLLWGMDRQRVRELLKAKFNIDDSIVDFSQYNNGDTSKNIIQRRDVYENYKDQKNYFFLSFDTNDKLTEIELHHGFTISIESIIIDFLMNIEKVVELLTKVSNDQKQLSQGEYFFKELKLTIASSKAMGGEGNELSYFYCSKDVTHLV